MTRTPAALNPYGPGACAVHGYELVDHRHARIRWPYLDVRTVCPATSGHTLDDRDRCRWCGGPLYPIGSDWRASSPRRAFCSSRCRVRAHRAGRRTLP